MKKKYLFIPLVLVIATNMSIAHEVNTNSFIELRSGFSLNSGKESASNKSPLNSKADFNNSYIVGMSMGFKPSCDWKIALSIDYAPKWTLTHQAEYRNGMKTFYRSNVSTTSATIDIVYDINKLSYNKITPYVMTGVGLAVNNISDTDFFVDNIAILKFYEQSTTNLAWKIGAGVNYDITDKIYMNLGYTYANLGKIGSNIAKSYPNSDPGYENPSYHQTLQPNLVYNKYKKLTSHRFMIGIGFKL